MRPDLVVPGENEENFVVARDARVVTVPFSPIEKRFANVAESELHRTFILRDALPAISRAFNVSNIRVVTQG